MTDDICTIKLLYMEIIKAVLNTIELYVHGSEGCGPHLHCTRPIGLHGKCRPSGSLCIFVCNIEHTVVVDHDKVNPHNDITFHCIPP